ncbi:Uncharacterized protein TCM_043004 [Theobroma cacao]|uniref:Uncharacterized protein n=1 Tax=Theobroma cacao TaxID=3641 RepID=A0A061FNZ8_THECC|nr:Uncharacterized protein TCM_043004 [Theobroma cacao]
MMKKRGREVRLAGCVRTLPGTSLTCQTRRIRVWQDSGTCPWVPRDKAMGRAPSRTRESGIKERGHCSISGGGEEPATKIPAATQKFHKKKSKRDIQKRTEKEKVCSRKSSPTREGARPSMPPDLSPEGRADPGEERRYRLGRPTVREPVAPPDLSPVGESRLDPRRKEEFAGARRGPDHRRHQICRRKEECRENSRTFKTTAFWLKKAEYLGHAHGLSAGLMRTGLSRA